MQTELDNTVQYYIPMGNSRLHVNSLIGKNIKIRFLDSIKCVICDKQIDKSFFQGFCYSCFTTAPQAEECVLKPELCRAHEGVARDMEYATKNCLSEQIVYLSITDNVKVGVTRVSQIPTRWIDQGATKAIVLARVPNRYTAGMLEVNLKEFFTDKTNWQRMLKNTCIATMSLSEAKEHAINNMSSEFKQYVDSDSTIVNIEYPVQKYPEKIKTINLDKTGEYQGKLVGIKGQYLIFEDDSVINIRKFSGYKIDLFV